MACRESFRRRRSAAHPGPVGHSGVHGGIGELEASEAPNFWRRIMPRSPPELPIGFEHRSSIASQGGHGVDAGGSARRNVSGKKSHGAEKQDHSREGRWIDRLGSEQQ
jgi:hypothetical protein